MPIAMLRRSLTTILLVGTAAVLVISCAGGRHGPLLPAWGPPDLTRPSDSSTGRRLARLAENPDLCMSLLQQAEVRHTPLPAVHQPPCGYGNAVRLDPQGTSIRWAPTGLGVSCPVAAGLYLWERDVVQPAAQTYFGSRIVTIDHFGSYACRRIGGGGNLSEHARANAVDIAGFRLANGTRITVARDWNGGGAPAAFLREVREGACKLFGTTLSPDYNAAHNDHLHFDQAVRAWGGYCR